MAKNEKIAIVIVRYGLDVQGGKRLELGIMLKF